MFEFEDILSEFLGNSLKKIQQVVVDKVRSRGGWVEMSARTTVQIESLWRCCDMIVTPLQCLGMDIEKIS